MIKKNTEGKGLENDYINFDYYFAKCNEKHQYLYSI